LKAALPSALRKASGFPARRQALFLFSFHPGKAEPFRKADGKAAFMAASAYKGRPDIGVLS
jgi:hypothetical protein